MVSKQVVLIYPKCLLGQPDHCTFPQSFLDQSIPKHFIYFENRSTDQNTRGLRRWHLWSTNKEGTGYSASISAETSLTSPQKNTYLKKDFFPFKKIHERDQFITKKKSVLKVTWQKHWRGRAPESAALLKSITAHLFWLRIHIVLLGLRLRCTRPVECSPMTASTTWISASIHMTRSGWCRFAQSSSGSPRSMTMKGGSALHTANTFWDHEKSGCFIASFRDACIIDIIKTSMYRIKVSKKIRV